MKYLIFIFLLLVSCTKTNKEEITYDIINYNNSDSLIANTDDIELVKYITTYKDTTEGKINSVFAKYNNPSFNSNNLNESLFSDIYSKEDSIFYKIDNQIKTLLKKCLPTANYAVKGVWLYIYPYNGNVSLNFIWFKESVDNKSMTEEIISFAKSINEDIKLPKKTDIKNRETCYTQYAVYW